ncbi:MAG: alpha/beta hydrolase [Burkholderiaceae bacterium]
MAAGAGSLPPLPAGLLAPGIRSRYVPGINGLRMHVLEAGFETPGRPCVLLLHGFPELAYSWRKIMPALARAGYHVLAPDQRGYGRTTPEPVSYDDDIAPYRMTNLVRDALGLVAAFGYRSVAAVVGHDFGAPVAAWCALIRPDVFRSVALLSAPFGGPPALPSGMAARDADDGAPAPRPSGAAGGVADVDIHAALAALPRPRVHYQWYYSTPAADADMRRCPQGVHAFLRAYYHVKSADWPGNDPQPLRAWTADELARMPTYYVLDRGQTMAQACAPQMPSPEAIAANAWLPDAELRVYSDEYRRTGFQGGLQWYRCSTSGRFTAEMQTWSGCRIEVPATFIAGSRDWGMYQKPGELERMQRDGCARFLGAHVVDGAGHWVQQEQPARVVELLLSFFGRAGV